MLNSVESYSAALNIDTMTATRIAITHLQNALPAMKEDAVALIEQGVSDTIASRESFRKLAEESVPLHIEKAMQLMKSGRTINSLINKPSFYTSVQPHI